MQTGKPTIKMGNQRSGPVVSVAVTSMDVTLTLTGPSIGLNRRRRGTAREGSLRPMASRLQGAPACPRAAARRATRVGLEQHQAVRLPRCEGTALGRTNGVARGARNRFSNNLAFAVFCCVAARRANHGGPRGNRQIRGNRTHVQCSWLNKDLPLGSRCNEGRSGTQAILDAAVPLAAEVFPSWDKDAGDAGVEVISSVLGLANFWLSSVLHVSRTKAWVGSMTT